MHSPGLAGMAAAGINRSQDTQTTKARQDEVPHAWTWLGKRHYQEESSDNPTAVCPVALLQPAHQQKWMRGDHWNERGK